MIEIIQIGLVPMIPSVAHTISNSLLQNLYIILNNYSINAVSGSIVFSGSRCGIDFTTLAGLPNATA